MKSLDLTGDRYGRLRVIEKLGFAKGLTYWRCVCDCGGSKVAVGKRLRNGATASCGCLGREILVARNEATATHGMTGSPTWISWDSMIQRCTNPNHKSYPDYGGRGIEVCARWMEFQSFYADMDARLKGTTLDRSRVNGNYEPGNCVWSSGETQGNNKRSSVFIQYEGRSQTLIQWARESGIPPKTFMYRIKKGWTMKEAMTIAASHGNGRKRGAA